MAFEVSYNLENEQQFWDELDEIVSSHCQSHELIDNALRTYLSFTTNHKGEYLNSEYAVDRCSYKLLSSPLFAAHADYVRRQIVFGLLQDDAPDVLLFIVSFLLFDGRDHESIFEIMNNEGAFPRLIELIHTRRGEEEVNLHRLLMELLYEMSRIQRVKVADLVHVDDDFVQYLFQIIEEVSDDASDPYHYPVIRVLLVLNEQFMVAAHDPSVANTGSIPLTNKVIKVLSAKGNQYKTFGENIILLLNRESETSLQLLTLKLLYLLFTTPPTHEYFYTNDLRVLVDILIRNLLDLPEEASALRHTYLRVLYPLLAHTQLRLPPHYKRDEIKKLLHVLYRGQPSEEEDAGRIWHFEEVDDTTKRLVIRCKKVSWLKDHGTDSTLTSPVEGPKKASGETTSPIEPPPPPTPRKLVKRNSSNRSTLSKTSTLTVTPVPSHLGVNDSAHSSSLSVLEVAAQREKPGVITPSRKDGAQGKQKEKPMPPQARRSAWRRAKAATPGEEAPPAGVAENGGKPETTPNNTAHGEVAKAAAAEADRSLEKANGVEMAMMPTETVATATNASSSHKKPPPPKTRRWRGKRAKEEDEGGGGEGAHPAPPHKNPPPVPSQHHHHYHENPPPVPSHHHPHLHPHLHLPLHPHLHHKRSQESAHSDLSDTGTATPPTALPPPPPPPPARSPERPAPAPPIGMAASSSPPASPHPPPPCNEGPPIPTIITPVSPTSDPSLTSPSDTSSPEAPSATATINGIDAALEATTLDDESDHQPLEQQSPDVETPADEVEEPNKGTMEPTPTPLAPISATTEAPAREYRSPFEDEDHEVSGD